MCEIMKWKMSKSYFKIKIIILKNIWYKYGSSKEYYLRYKNNTSNFKKQYQIKYNYTFI